MVGAGADHGFEDVVFSDGFVVVAGAAEAAVEVDGAGAGVAGGAVGVNGGLGVGRGDDGGGFGGFVEGGGGGGGGGG